MTLMSLLILYIKISPKSVKKGVMLVELVMICGFKEWALAWIMISFKI